MALLPGDIYEVQVKDDLHGGIPELFGLQRDNDFRTFRFWIQTEKGRQHLIEGIDYEVLEEGRELDFRKPIPAGSTLCMMKRMMSPFNQHEVLLLPRQMGHHIFSQEALEEMVQDCVGKVFPVKNYTNQLPKAANGQILEDALVIEAELKDDGIHAVLELF